MVQHKQHYVCMIKITECFDVYTIYNSTTSIKKFTVDTQQLKAECEGNHKLCRHLQPQKMTSPQACTAHEQIQPKRRTLLDSSKYLPIIPSAAPAQKVTISVYMYVVFIVLSLYVQSLVIDCGGYKGGIASSRLMTSHLHNPTLLPIWCVHHIPHDVCMCIHLNPQQR